MDPSSAMGSNLLLGVFNGTRLSEVEGFLVGKYDGEVIRRSDGGFVGNQQSLFTRTIRRLLGRVVCGMGDLVGVMDGRLLGDIDTKVAGLFLPRRLH